jgi:hypothetical protein
VPNPALRFRSVVGGFLALALVSLSLIAAPSASATCACSADDVANASEFQRANAVLGARIVVEATPVDFVSQVGFSDSDELVAELQVHRVLDNGHSDAVGATLKVTFDENRSYCEGELPRWLTERITGERVVVFADGDDGLATVRHDRGCDPEITPEELDAIVEVPRATPDGEGAVVAVAGLNHRGATMVAFDAQGRVLSWGAGDEPAVGLTACVDHPAYVVEIFHRHLALRDLNTMDITDTFELTGGRNAYDDFAIDCTVGSGGALELTVSDATTSPDTSFDFGEGLDLDGLRIENSSGVNVIDATGEVLQRLANYGNFPSALLAVDGPEIVPADTPEPKMRTVNAEAPPQTSDSPATTSEEQAAGDDSDGDSGGGSTVLVVAGVLVLLAALAAGGVAALRRRTD